MFPIFVCIVALIAKVLFLFLTWRVSYTFYQLEEGLKYTYKNAEFDGYETFHCTGGDCEYCSEGS
jgi:hypothetical protein